MEKEQINDTRYIPVLDGIRVLAVLVVAWFHFWQQSWLMPIGFGINLDWLPRTGYVMVDLLLLLSGFCLFLPHARHLLLGEKLGDTMGFYVRRLVRILPCYLFCILLLFFGVNLPTGAYASTGEMLKDLLTHLSFTHTFSLDTYVGSKLNVVLWTLAIEMQFYLIFPLLAYCFRKKPLLTYGIMVGLSLVFCGYITTNHQTLPFPLLMNQLPTFLGVYANGMMGALVVVTLAANKTRQRYAGYFFTGVSLFCLFLYWLFMDQLCKSPDIQVWQVQWRFPLSILFTVFLVSAVFASKGFRVIFGNPVMRFLSGISFNFYIWHQYLAVQLKLHKIPFWQGEVPPNQTGDVVWMWQYSFLVWAVSLAAAILTTYFIERPAAAFLLKRWTAYKARGKAGSH